MNARRERPLRDVPLPVRWLLVVALALHLGWRGWPQPETIAPSPLPPPPSAQMLTALSLHEPLALARLLTLWLQAFDSQQGQFIRYRQMDYHRLSEWLGRILELDPRGQYPLLLASRVYAEVNDPARQRLMLDFVYQQAVLDPRRRWPWLAQAAVVADRRLADLPLALQYARAIPADPAIPYWAQDLSLIILEKLGRFGELRELLRQRLAQTLDAEELAFLARMKARLDQRDPR
jgi:hypothetical protein